MDKNKSAVESFLGELDNGNRVETFEKEIIPEEKGEKGVKEGDKEEKLPFHKDPKIQKYLERREREMEERIKSSIPKPEEKQTEEDGFKETIEAFTAIIGNDTPEKVSALNALKRSLNSLDQRASEKAIEKLDEIRQRESQEDIEAEEELNTAFDAIEDVYDVDITSNSASAVKTRQEFVAFVEKIAPKDREGNIVDYPDMQSAWETFSQIRSKEPNRSKDIASRSMARSNDAPANTQERVNWNKVDEFMDTLQK